MKREDIEGIIKTNVKWSPYGVTHYDTIDSYTKTAEAILALHQKDIEELRIELNKLYKESLEKALAKSKG